MGEVRRSVGRGPRGGAMGNLHRTAGNQVVGELIRRDVVDDPSVDRPNKKSAATDYDNMQFRVTKPPGATPPPGTAPYTVQVVVRRVDKKGKPYYEATGEVIDFSSKLPVIRHYSAPISLKGWTPRVTHVNGMGVMPESGMTSAKALAGAVEQSSGKAVDVLYTYSAQKSNIVKDLWSCLKGKASVKDDVTRSQTETMIDAVTAKRRISVSAHSRGTIKTDNAVRTAFKALVARLRATLDAGDPSVKKEAQRQELLLSAGPTAPVAHILALDFAKEEVAKRRVKRLMDRYIQLIYAGNAVTAPSSVLPVKMFVGKRDPISMAVGTYTDAGAKLYSGNKRTSVTKVEGGHGYTQNYADHVGDEIGQDVAKDKGRGGS